MEISDLKGLVHKKLFERLKIFPSLRPAQAKAIEKGLLKRKNILICTPTASGKTLIAEIACINSILNNVGKAIYVVPLKALTTEKYHEFTKNYKELKIGLAIGDSDSKRDNFSDYDFLITTSEKLDSLIRHHSPWLASVTTVVVDEVHLLNDPGRGPTLEILITILKKMLPKLQLVALSATIGNPKELAKWLDAELVEDTWRPVKLKQGVYIKGKIKF